MLFDITVSVRVYFLADPCHKPYLEDIRALFWDGTQASDSAGVDGRFVDASQKQDLGRVEGFWNPGSQKVWHSVWRIGSGGSFRTLWSSDSFLHSSLDGFTYGVPG